MSILSKETKKQAEQLFVATVAGIITVILFWVTWNLFGIGERYFFWLPIVFQKLPLMDCFYLVVVISLLKKLLTPWK